MGDFWDEHDLADHLREWKPVEFEIDLRGESIYFPVETSLAAELARLARKQGVSAETLINLWVQEKVKRVKRTKHTRPMRVPVSARSRSRSGAAD